MSTIQHLFQTRTARITLLAIAVLLTAVAMGPFVAYLAAIPFIGGVLLWLLPNILAIVKFAAIAVTALGTTSIVGARRGKELVSFPSWTIAAQTGIRRILVASDDLSKFDWGSLRVTESLEKIKRVWNDISGAAERGNKKTFFENGRVMNLAGTVFGEDQINKVSRILSISTEIVDASDGLSRCGAYNINAFDELPVIFGHDPPEPNAEAADGVLMEVGGGTTATWKVSTDFDPAQKMRAILCELQAGMKEMFDGGVSPKAAAQEEPEIEDVASSESGEAPKKVKDSGLRKIEPYYRGLLHFWLQFLDPEEVE
ncbi:MAG: hypothetical protein LBS68_02355 [Puniceicoccales bacterium]|nr:hypothetical protein [Puniceicoccales bacterium]